MRRERKIVRIVSGSNAEYVTLKLQEYLDLGYEMHGAPFSDGCGTIVQAVSGREYYFDEEFDALNAIRDSFHSVVINQAAKTLKISKMLPQDSLFHDAVSYLINQHGYRVQS